jgi:hypothetical protein
MLKSARAVKAVSVSSGLPKTLVWKADQGGALSISICWARKDRVCESRRTKGDAGDGDRSKARCDALQGPGDEARAEQAELGLACRAHPLYKTSLPRIEFDQANGRKNFVDEVHARVGS